MTLKAHNTSANNYLSENALMKVISGVDKVNFLRSHKQN